MRMLGKFEIFEEIGRGGFARVYRARDPGLDREVALKVLAPHLTWDPTFAERFRQEAQATAKLRHPNIVVIHEVGQDGEDLYIAMEYLPGQTLARLLAEQGALELDRALPILDQVASALDYAHGEGVLHRDIKPSNVMVQEGKGGEVWATLTDFGLVKAMEGSQSLTSKGTILGSPHYMAPEQADIKRTHEIGPATDLYSLGVVAYEMLVGQLPFPGDTTSTLMARLQYDPPDPQSIRDDLPEDVAQVLLKALSREGKDRYPSAGAMVQALRKSVEAREEARQREEQLVHLYQQIEESVAAQDWRTAEARCREIMALDPDYRDVPELWMRVRSERAHQRELDQLYQAVQAASERRSWAEVKELCLKIQALEPAYRDVDALLAWAEKEQGAEQAAKERKAHLATLYSQAQAALEDKRWQEAVRLCNEIQASQPGYRDVDVLLRQARAGLYEAQAQKEKQEQLATLYSQAQAASRKKRWEELWRLCGEIGVLEPGYRDTEALRARAEEELAREEARRRPEAPPAGAREEGEVAPATDKGELPAPDEEIPALDHVPGAAEPVPAKKRRKIPRGVWVGGIVAVVLVIVGVVAWRVNEAAQYRAWATPYYATRAVRRTATAQAGARATAYYATWAVPSTSTAQVEARPTLSAAAAAGSTAGAAAGQAAATAAAWAAAETRNAAADATQIAKLTAVAELQAVAEWRPRIQETFDDNTLGWDVGDYDSEWSTDTQSIAGGVYRWESTARKSLFGRCGRDVEFGAGDFYLSVEVTLTQGAGAYGLAFREADRGNFYAWLIYESSHASWVTMQVDGEWAEAELGQFETPAILEGEANRLTVVGIGSHFRFFVNDQFVGELYDATHAEGDVDCAIELSEGDTSVLEFDNFELYTP